MTDRNTPTPPPLSSMGNALPSDQGYFYVWHPMRQQASHLMSHESATNLALVHFKDGARVHLHPDAPLSVSLGVVGKSLGCVAVVAASAVTMVYLVMVVVDFVAKVL